MLPEVNYDKLNEDSIFEDRLVDLEYETMTNMSDFIDALKELLLREKMIQPPEIMVSYLCAYLGFFAGAGLGKNKAGKLQPAINNLIEIQSGEVYKTFLKYNIQKTEGSNKNLQAMRDASPGSIVAQTMRLGRVIGDTMQDLNFNRDTLKKQTQWFCPQVDLLKLLANQVDRNIRTWKDSSIAKPILHAVNQSAMQIAWLMGYFAYLDNEEPTKYLEFGLPLVTKYGQAVWQTSL
jgi:hypothetical protein